MFAFTATMRDKRFPATASGLMIGLMVTVCILMGGVWIGASMNPARSLATALFAYRVEPQALSQIWIYLLAPVIGAIVAALVYEFLRPKEFAKSTPEDLVQVVQAVQAGELAKESNHASSPLPLLEEFIQSLLYCLMQLGSPISNFFTPLW